MFLSCEKVEVFCFSSLVLFSFRHPDVIISGCGKREAYTNWSMVTCTMAAPVTGITLRTAGPVPADSRQ